MAVVVVVAVTVAVTVAVVVVVVVVAVAWTDLVRSGGRTGAKPAKCGTCGGKGSIFTDRHVSGVGLGVTPLPESEVGEVPSLIPPAAWTRACGEDESPVRGL
jgi:hypothetical protein